MIDIVRVESTRYGVMVELANGVSFNVSCNENYLNISFSGDKDGVKPQQHAANVVNISFEPRRGS